MSREIRPRLRLAFMLVLGVVLLLLGGMITSSGTTFPPGLLFVVFGLITIGRTVFILVAGGRADSAWARDPQVAAGSLGPYIVAGVALAAAYITGMLPGGFGAAIICLVFAGGVGYWISQYLLGEMAYNNGIWCSRERWLDPPVSRETMGRWATEKPRRAAAKRH